MHFEYKAEAPPGDLSAAIGARMPRLARGSLNLECGMVDEIVEVPEPVGLASHFVNERWIVLTHDLDKRHNWWADGPFDSRQDAEAHTAKLRIAAIEGKGLQKGLLENTPKYVRSRTVHQVLVLVDPKDRARMERWT